MTSDAKTFIGLVALALIGAIAWRYLLGAPTADITVAASDDMVSNIPSPRDMASGPAYLVYNQPWFFAPPVYNMLPSVTAGQIGHQVGTTEQMIPLQNGNCVNC